MPTKKKVLLLGSVPMALDELQMAPAMIGAFVRKRGHDFAYRDINLELFQACQKDHDSYVNQVEFLQDRNLLHQTNDVVSLWQESQIEAASTVDVVLINVFSVFSQIPALRLTRAIRHRLPGVKIIMGGIGSHKKLLGSINQFTRPWAMGFFARVENEIFGQLCLDNDLIDDWQPNVDMDRLTKWLPQQPVISYNREFEFDQYRIDHYQWGSGGKRIPVLGSHGCVRQCSFCDVIKHFPRYSFIEADALTKSIVEAWNQTGIGKVQFMDSLVNGSMRNFLRLLKNLAQARKQQWLPDDFSWSGTYICRPTSRLLEEIHQYLPQSGAENLVIGVETGSDRVRYEMQKKFKNEDLLYELCAFRRHGIKATALFFPSWPTETQSDFLQTLDLFDRLAEFGQDRTLHSVQLGSNGFSLIDGTPIDRDKKSIGLSQGPISWLWQCDTNKSLTFWETLRRRLLMAAWCEMRGIYLGQQESTFRRYLAFNLEQHRDTILQYSGHLPAMIEETQYLPSTLRHSIKLKVINRGQHPVIMKISIDNLCRQYVCDAGVTSIDFVFERYLSRSQTLTVDFNFVPQHITQWNTYDSGDYFDNAGLYLDDIWVDHCDITYWGWNQIVDTEWIQQPDLPRDYYLHRNLRCITAGMRLNITMPQHHSLHKYLAVRREPSLDRERGAINQRLEQKLSCFLK